MQCHGSPKNDRRHEWGGRGPVRSGAPGRRSGGGRAPGQGRGAQGCSHGPPQSQMQGIQYLESMPAIVRRHPHVLAHGWYRPRGDLASGSTRSGSNAMSRWRASLLSNMDAPGGFRRRTSSPSRQRSHQHRASRPCSSPVVASAVGGLVELLGRDGSRGRLVKLVDWGIVNHEAPKSRRCAAGAVRLADAISDLLDDAGARARMVSKPRLRPPSPGTWRRRSGSMSVASAARPPLTQPFRFRRCSRDLPGIGEAVRSGASRSSTTAPGMDWRDGTVWRRSGGPCSPRRIAQSPAAWRCLEIVQPIDASGAGRPERRRTKQDFVRVLRKSRGIARAPAVA